MERQRNGWMERWQDFLHLKGTLTGCSSGLLWPSSLSWTLLLQFLPQTNLPTTQLPSLFFASVMLEQGDGCIEAADSAFLVHSAVPLSPPPIHKHADDETGPRRSLVRQVDPLRLSEVWGVMETLGSIASLECRRGKLGLGLLKILAPISQENMVLSSLSLTLVCFQHPKSVRSYPIPERRSRGSKPASDLGIYGMVSYANGRDRVSWSVQWDCLQLRLYLISETWILRFLGEETNSRATYCRNWHAQALSHHVRTVSPGLLWEDSRAPSGMASLSPDQNQKI